MDFPHLEAHIRQRTAMQEGINCKAGVTAADVRKIADADHAQYPQYAGYWNEAKLVQMTMAIKSKGGVAFECGDITIGLRVGRQWVVYSIRLGWNVGTEFGVTPVPEPYTATAPADKDFVYVVMRTRRAATWIVDVSRILADVQMNPNDTAYKVPVRFWFDQVEYTPSFAERWGLTPLYVIQNGEIINGEGKGVVNSETE